MMDTEGKTPFMVLEVPYRRGRIGAPNMEVLRTDTGIFWANEYEKDARTGKIKRVRVCFYREAV